MAEAPQHRGFFLEQHDVVPRQEVEFEPLHHHQRPPPQVHLSDKYQKIASKNKEGKELRRRTATESYCGETLEQSCFRTSSPTQQVFLSHLYGNVDAVVNAFPHIKLRLGNYDVFKNGELFRQSAITPVHLIHTRHQYKKCMRIKWKWRSEDEKKVKSKSKCVLDCNQLLKK